jgi:tetratricopeptide (TPR) repeat protein
MSESIEPENPQTPVEPAVTPTPPADAANTDAADQLELKLPDESSAPKDLALWAGVLVLLTLIAYWPATDGSFLWRDDRAADSAQFVGPGALGRSWSQRWSSPESYGLSVYQPVALTAYWLEYQAGGHTAAGLPSPMVYHIASLVFLAGGAIFLWLVLRELKLPGAWLAAAVFVLHPMHAEAVSWIDQQPIALAGLFFFGSVYTYLLFLQNDDRDRAERAAGRQGVDPAITWGFYAGSALLSLLAMLSSPSAFVLPAIILLLLWWKNRFTSRDALLLLPLLLIGLFLWFKNAGLATPGDHPDLFHAGLLQQAIAVGHGLGFSIIKLIAPLGFEVIYPPANSALGLAVLVLVIGLLVVLFLVQSIIGRGWFFAVASFALLSAASLNWFDAGRLSFVTDAAAYLSIAPLTAVVIVLISRNVRRVLQQSALPQATVGASAVLMVVLGGLSWARAHVFDSPVAMWRDLANKRPDYVLAEASLAEQLRLQAEVDAANNDKTTMSQDFDEAIQHAKAALALDPDNASAQRTWANVLVAQGDDASALAHFDAALRPDPENSPINQEYGSALLTLGRFDAARRHLNLALKGEPGSPDLHRLLGKAYAGLGNFDRAISEETLATGMNYTDAAAWLLLADAQARAGRLDDAMQSYAKVPVYDPTQMTRPDVFVAMSKVRDRQGNYASAVEYLKLAQKVPDPDEKADGLTQKKIDQMVSEEEEKARRAAATRPATSQSATAPATAP